MKDNNYNIDDLKCVYKMLSEIMEKEFLTKDTSFVRVRSFISNTICDILTKDMLNDTLEKI